MVHRIPRSFLSLAFVLAASLASIASAQTNRFFQDEDLEDLAATLAAHDEARSSGEDLGEARVALEASLAALDERVEGEGPLRLAADLGRAAWLARDYAGRKVKPGKVVKDTVSGGSFGAIGVGFAYRLPKSYDPEATAYPLILSIPDVDERPADHLRARWTDRDVLDGAILISPEMPAASAEWDRVMISGRPGGLAHVLTVLRVATERFGVDFDRVYVVGHGQGVPAALAAGNYGPQKFAGVIGRGGDAGDLAPDNFENLPTLFYGGGPEAQAFRKAVQAAGYDNCSLETGEKTQELWTWIRDHPRTTTPESVTVVPGDPFPTRAYWLRVAPSAVESRTTATLERDDNTIRVTGAGVSSVTLYLSDALVDLDRPVRVVCNDVEYSVRVERHLATTLDLLQDGTSDPACVYVALATFDTTGTASASLDDTPLAEDTEYAEQLQAALGDPVKLFALYEWCQSTGRVRKGQRALETLLRLQPDHEAAHAALGHGGEGGRWFPSAEDFERYRLGQTEAVASAKGHVEHKSGWLHVDERSLANKGWVKDRLTGRWLSGADRRKLAAGWARQDLAWIAPDDVARLDEGLWLVDGEWVDLETANRRHARIDSMWSVPSGDVLLHSTADRDVTLRALREMGRTIPDLNKVFGAEPVLPLEVVLLRDEEQYDRFAFGDPDGRRPLTDQGRVHVVHSAYFAESRFERVKRKFVFRGTGVCYWDSLAPNGDLFGVHAARLAVGLSYVEALDPSLKTVKKALQKGPRVGYAESYAAEKKLPAWLRWGGAVYGERFFRDTRVGADGDPWWARAWSIGEIGRRGGLRSLDEILAFALDPDDRDDAQKLQVESGLVVAFMVDGECEPVNAAHAELKRALAAGRLQPSDVAALEAAIRANEAELKAFAGL